MMVKIDITIKDGDQIFPFFSGSSGSIEAKYFYERLDILTYMAGETLKKLGVKYFVPLRKDQDSGKVEE